jgi:hypothetical protein
MKRLANFLHFLQWAESTGQSEPLRCWHSRQHTRGIGFGRLRFDGSLLIWRDVVETRKRSQGDELAG